ncbi:hypothetical protein WJX73_006447 [Symbiochloris irregularis]|uniref:Glutaredoxin-like protein n=1 Tax=Symbiochloris irregularis TaxID=706552 RepID=A0AAW1NMQ5_9CHLO
MALRQCRAKVPLVRQYSAAAASAAPASKAGQYRLVMYSRGNCPLCDGLKEKVDAVLAKAEFMPSPLTGMQLEVRDISTRQEWQEAYGMTIPVLARVDADGSNEVKISRSPPRISAERLAAHLESALQS